MADFLSEKRAEIDRRLQELRPLHEEYLKLERAKAALDGVDDGPDGDAARRGPGRPRGSRNQLQSGGSAAQGNGRRRRRGRPRGGKRAEEALEQVRQNPGITVSELADRLGMKQRNYLYRVMSNLQSEGAVSKQGQGFYAG